MTNALAAIDVVVRDGSTVCLRRAEERDLQALLEFLSSLSPESLYYRFLGLPSLTAARVRALSAADGRTGMSLVVEFPPSTAPGTKVWLTATFQSERGLTSPACIPVSANIGFGGPALLGESA